MNRLKQKGLTLTITTGTFSVFVLVTAYAHMRYAQAERVYLHHMQTITFSPHTNSVGGLSAYSIQANHWLMIQAICTGGVLLATLLVLVGIMRARQIRLTESAVPEAAK